MKDAITTPGKTYSVHTMKGCTIIEPDGWQKAIEAPDGYFDAHFGSVVIEGDDEASIKQLFKLAPQQKLAILGVLGGNGGLPAGFKRVEWLDCARSQIQYIETPVYVDKDCEISAVILNESCTTICRTSQLNKSGLLTQTQIWDGSDFGSWWGESNPFNNITLSQYVKLGEKSEIKNSATGLSCDGVLFPRDNTSSASALTKLTFFVSSFIQGYKGARIYQCAITKNGKYLFRGLPCLDSTGTPCMYDTVSKRPFYNLGTGDFIYPTESTTYALRRVLPDWGKLTEHGLRRLYHAPANYQGELYDYALENGYKPIVEPEMPEEGYWSPRWTETEDEIVLEWVETEPPMDEPLTETE